MISIEESEIGNNVIVHNANSKINATIVEKPFYDPKKKITSAKL